MLNNPADTKAAFSPLKAKKLARPKQETLVEPESGPLSERKLAHVLTRNLEALSGELSAISRGVVRSRGELISVKAIP